MMPATDPLLSALSAHHNPVTRVAIGSRRIAFTPEFWFCITEDHGPAPQKLVLISDIQEAVARHYGLTVHDLLSDRRTQREALPRHVAMYLCKTLSRRPYNMIARLFNRADHSVAMHGVNRIAEMIETDPGIAADIAQISRALA